MTDNVFREVSFRFRGEECTLTPSIGLLQRIRSKGINTSVLADQCRRGPLDMLDLLEAAKVFLAAAEMPATDEEIYGWVSLMDDEVASFMIAYMQAVHPRIDFGKKPDAPEQKKPAKKKPAKKAAT